MISAEARMMGYQERETMTDRPSRREEMKVEGTKRTMFVVEVDVVKQWTDRGGTDWVTVAISAEPKASDGGNLTEVDVMPESLYQLRRSLIEVTDG